MTQRITQDDVGQIAGVAGATVSRALSPEWRKLGISEQTHERIMHVARRLGYHRAPASTDSTGVPEIGLCFHHFWPCNIGVMMDLPNAVFLGAEEFGWAVRCLPLAEGAASWRTGLGHGLLGMLVLHDLAVELEGLLAAVGKMPLVLINWPTGLPIDQILADDQAGMAMMAEHLMSVGHRHVLLAGMDGERHQSSLQARLAGLHRSGLIVDECYGGPKEIAEHIAQGHPATAVVTQGDHIAALLLAELSTLGIRVPMDLTMVSANDSPLLSYLSPPVSAVRVPIDHMVYAGLVRLRERAGGAEVAPPVILAEHLVHRASVAPPAARKGNRVLRTN